LPDSAPTFLVAFTCLNVGLPCPCKVVPDHHTEFVLAAWHPFVLPAAVEDRGPYLGPGGASDVCLEYEWNASDADPEIEQRACAGVLLDVFKLDINTQHTSRT
jgi:hypothetical protein